MFVTGGATFNSDVIEEKHLYLDTRRETRLLNWTLPPDYLAIQESGQPKRAVTSDGARHAVVFLFVLRISSSSGGY